MAEVGGWTSEGSQWQPCRHGITIVRRIRGCQAGTGDALFIRSNGRTDFQGGSAEKLFNSVRTKLFTLPDDTIVYPGYDYSGRVSSTIGEEKKSNELLKLSANKHRDYEGPEDIAACQNGYRAVR